MIAIRHKDPDGTAWHGAGDLYLPLLRAFEEAGKAQELFGLDTSVLFPNAEASLASTMLPNPVEVFLGELPSQRKKQTCLEVLGELILRRPFHEIPDLVTVWEFLSAYPSDLDLQLGVYDSEMHDWGCSAGVIRRRLAIAVSFLQLCHELGYIQVDESSGDVPRWLRSRNSEVASP